MYVKAGGWCRPKAVGAMIAVLTATIFASAVPSTVSATTPDVLVRPALQSARAPTSVMLAVTRADKRIVAVGERGIALWSDDEGKTWQQAQVPVSVSLTNVRFADAKHGWAVGHSGVVLRSDDGGATWSKQLDGIQAAQLMLAAAKAGLPGAGRDSGTAVANAERLIKEGPGKPFLDVYAFDAQRALIVGAFGLAYTTQDGGATWAPALDRIDNPQGKHLYAVTAQGKGYVIAGEMGAVLSSIDGGNDFTSLTTPYEGSYFGALEGAAGTMIVYGLRGNVYWSNDAGANWKKSVLGTTGTITAGLRLASGKIVLLDDGGRVLASDDDGRHFTLAPVAQSAPYTGVVQTSDGSLVLSGVRGMTRVAFDGSAKAKTP